MKKLGAIVGDGCEFGCNSVTCPGVFLKPLSIIYPLVTVKKGFYKKGEVIRKTNL